MNKWLIFLAIFILIVSSTGCSSGTPAVDTPSIQDTPTLEPTEVIPPTSQAEFTFSTVPIDDVQNIIWLWQSQVEGSNASQSIVSNPENYTLVLLQDGTFTAKADCNNLQGTYQVNGNELELIIGITTLSECGPESQYDQYLQNLQNTTAFGMHDGNLVLQLKNSAGLLTFSNGGIYSSQPERSCEAGIDPANVSINTQTLPEPLQTGCVYETPYDSSQPPGPTGLPDHIEILFSDADPGQVPVTDPILYIISVNGYENLWDTAGNPAVTEGIEALRQILLDKPQPPTTSLPILPFERVTGVSDIQAKVAYLDSQKTTGVRFVTRFVQSPNPLTSDNPPLFYVYQGLSFDGAFLVSYFYPVTVPSLPASDEVSQEEINQVESDPEAYIQIKTDQLNALQSSDFVPNLDTLDQVIQSLNWTSGAAIPEASPIANISWQWAELLETQPVTPTQTIIPDPYNYTITFAPDGSLALRADCNTATGSYSLNGPMVTIQLGPATQAACPEGSRSSQFISLVTQVNQFAVQGGRLALSLLDEAGSMIFNNGGLAVVLPPPAQGVPTATAKDAINVRSGPGTQYPSYGVAPVGAQAEVIGKSEDGKWWVIRLPAGYSSDNTGWVSADFVETTNTDTVPIIPSPPAPQ